MFLLQLVWQIILLSPLLTSTPCVGGVESEFTLNERNSWLVIKNIFDMLFKYLIILWLFFTSSITFLQFTAFVIFWNISILSCILINVRAWHTHLVNLVVSKIIVQYCIKYAWKYTNIYIIHYHTLIPHIICGLWIQFKYNYFWFTLCDCLIVSAIFNQISLQIWYGYLNDLETQSLLWNVNLPT